MYESESDSVAESGYSAQLSQLCAAIDNSRADVACYQHNFIGGLRQALEKSFPFTRQLLGDAAFAGVATAYAGNYPSVHWDINRYGEDFAGLLLAQRQGLRADACDWSLLSAIAELEYAICRLYYSSVDSTLNIAPSPSFAGAVEWRQGLRVCHPYVDIDPAINTLRPLMLCWQELRIVLTNVASFTSAGGEGV